ncbi:MAG: hypothetical protein IJD50_04270 [Clostridia bacterium]|nr:hypothetical protein [Clostridia bacterium]
MAKSDMPLARYFGKAKVILNKSLTRRQANITALAISLADRQISQIRLRIYLVAESLTGTRLAPFSLFVVSIS